MSLIGINSFTGMSLRGSPGSRHANADNAILASATPELLVILERSTLITSGDLEFCLQAANLRKR